MPSKIGKTCSKCRSVPAIYSNGWCKSCNYEYQRARQLAKKKKKEEHKDAYRAEWAANRAKHFPDRVPNKYAQKRAARDPQWAYMRKIHTAWRSALIQNFKHCYVMEALGYTPAEARRHFEQLFAPWMTWDNYGMKGWSIDHIQPQSSLVFASIDEENFRLCWDLSNLRPLCHKENSRLGRELLPAWAKEHYCPGQEDTGLSADPCHNAVVRRQLCLILVFAKIRS